jgi:hypothetical protein
MMRWVLRGGRESERNRDGDIDGENQICISAILKCLNRRSEMFLINNNNVDFSFRFAIKINFGRVILKAKNTSRNFIFA